jgi:hypothetical protein
MRNCARPGLRSERIVLGSVTGSQLPYLILRQAGEVQVLDAGKPALRDDTVRIV